MSSQWQLEELATCSRHSLVLTTLDGLSKIPFTVIIGAARTPVGLVIAGAHGDEYEGPAAIHDLLLETRSIQGQGLHHFCSGCQSSRFCSRFAPSSSR